MTPIQLLLNDINNTSTNVCNGSISKSMALSSLFKFNSRLDKLIKDKSIYLYIVRPEIDNLRDLINNNI